MVKKIALGAVNAVLLLGGEALSAQKPEAKIPPCEMKANPAPFGLVALCRRVLCVGCL